MITWITLLVTLLLGVYAFLGGMISAKYEDKWYRALLWGYFWPYLLYKRRKQENGTVQDNV